MGLTRAAPRQQLHQRRIQVDGYAREDGLWDIEAHLTDVKSYAFDNDWRGTLEPGDPVHDMWLRLTLKDDFTIVGVEAVSDATPFEICPAAALNFQRLVGLTIGPGWRRAVKERVGGTQGCTHLVELLQPLATIAFQTISVELQRRAKLARGDRSGSPPSRPGLLNTCHAFAEDGPVVQRYWPAAYKAKAS